MRSSASASLGTGAQVRTRPGARTHTGSPYGSAEADAPHRGRTTIIDVDAPLVLHHGTTLHAARRIVDVGWQALDVPALIDRLAHAYGVDSAAVREVLTQWGRFAVVAGGRGGNASFAPDAAKVAHRWAQRAPEAEWEALWAVYHLLHPSSDAEEKGWDSDLAGRTWVWDQMRHEPLAILSYVTTYSELAEFGALQGPGRRKLGLPEHILPAWNELTEISFNLPVRLDPTRLVMTPVPRHLPRDVYACTLGLTIEEFDRRAERGDFGEPASHGLTLDRTLFVQTPWWDSATAPLSTPTDV
jgi:hypothetical protein